MIKLNIKDSFQIIKFYIINIKKCNKNLKKLISLYVYFLSSKMK